MMRCIVLCGLKTVSQETVFLRECAHKEVWGTVEQLKLLPTDVYHELLLGLMD